jgi:hypothetical protein
MEKGEMTETFIEDLKTPPEQVIFLDADGEVCSKEQAASVRILSFIDGERQETYAFVSNPLTTQGGKGSGNFGHAGRPGSRGGSGGGGWSPTMSRADAEKWVQGSKYTEDVYHVTGLGNSGSIEQKGFDLSIIKSGRVFGDGVYASLDQASSRLYQVKSIGGRTETLTMKVKLDKPFEAVPHLIEKMKEKVSDKAAEIVNKDIKIFNDAIDKGLKYGTKERTDYFRKMGYTFKDYESIRLELMIKDLKKTGHDGIIIRQGRPTSYVGGNQVVVFNPKHVTVIK